MELLKCCWIRDNLENYNDIDLLWFNFIESSKRYITPEKAELIETPFSTLRVGVFWKREDGGWWNIKKDELVDIILTAKKAKMNAIQIHWFCDFAYLKMYNYLVFHSVSLEDNYDLNNKNIDFYIIDWKEAGSWKSYDYSKIKDLNLEKYFLVAGWISEKNVSEVFETFKNNEYFCWIDVASWVDNGENIDLGMVEEIFNKMS